MSNGTAHPTTQPLAPDSLKNWIMVVLTLIFISLYGAALMGWLRPLADERMVMRLEPIIFVIIGYYFGRLPGQQNERNLKEEINRQTQRADAAQSAKEQALQTSEALEERIKNVKVALGQEHRTGVTSSGSNLFSSGGRKHDDEERAVGAALRILNS